MKEFIIRKIKDVLRSIINRKNMIVGKYKNKNFYNELSNKDKIFIFDVPNHGNLGDQAIIFAEVEFLKEKYPDREIVEILTQDVASYILPIKNNIKKNDIVMLHGGGNFGVQYFNAERARRQVITNLLNNKILMFPQTLDFQNTKWGKHQQKKSVKIYKNNKNLTLVAREKQSYRMMKSEFDNNVILTPDIVLFLDSIKEVKQMERNGVKFFIRNDIESVLPKDKLDKMLSIADQKFGDVTLTDTVLNRTVDKYKRKDELFSKWSEFSSSELVVTDRLHGMVFAAITNTPCIVLSNYNHKVLGTFEWIKHLDFIKYCDNAEQAINEIKIFDKNKSFKTKYYSLENEFEELISLITD